MNTELFVARRLILDKESNKSISRSIVGIAIFGIALGLAVMIIAVAIVTGFKKEIRNKVIGFGAHIQIVNYDSNISYETVPVNKNQDFYPSLDTLPGIKHIEVFATKAGIIKTANNIQGVVIKGIGSDFDWTFFKHNLVEGNIFKVKNDSLTRNVLISKKIASLLNLHVGDDFAMFFVQDPPRMRRFTVSGIYETSLEEFDKMYILADIAHIQKLNNWSPDQVSGFEITIDDFDQLDYETRVVKNLVGFKFDENGSKLKVVNITQKYPQIFDWLNLQDMNVVVILVLMLVVAGFNMVSGLLILILERTNMIGILKALGSNNISIRKIFLYQSAFLVARGLFWGNLIGIGLCLLQEHFKFIKLDQSSYYIAYAPINLNLMHIILLNAGSLVAITGMLLIPSLIIARLSPDKTIRFT